MERGRQELGESRKGGGVREPTFTHSHFVFIPHSVSVNGLPYGYTPRRNQVVGIDGDLAVSPVPACAL